MEEVNKNNSTEVEPDRVLAQIVKINNVKPIENSDKILTPWAVSGTVDYWDV